MAAMNQNLGTYLAARLVQLGVTDYFCVPGDFNLVLLDQLLLDKRLRMINCCNELNAAYAADGYGRARGIGVVVVTFTVGGLSAINAVAGAFSDDIPLVVISGGPNSNDFGSERVLHHTIGRTDFGQQLECFKQFCCFSTVIKSVENACSKIDEALAKGLLERKPVYIEICCNLPAIEHYSCGPPRSNMNIVAQPSNSKNLADAVDALIHVLDSAVKPVVVAGRGVGKFKAQEAFMQFIRASGYAWACMPDAKGMLPESDERFIGTYWGSVSSPCTCEIVESADLYIFVGPRFNDYTTVGYSLLLSKPKMLEIRQRDIVLCGKDVFHCTHMSDVLAALATRVTKNSASLENYQRTFIPSGEPLNLNQPDSKLTCNVLFHHIQKMLTGNTAVVAETGDSWFNGQKLKLPDGCLYEFQMQFGSIGWSVGASLGMACALQGKKRVVSLIGDGSFQVTAQEVSTMIRFGMNNVVFLVNNYGYTIEMEIHDGPYNNIQSWNYCGMVEALNNGQHSIYTKRVETEGDLIEAIRIAGTRPDTFCFIECITARDDCSKELLEWGARVASANGRAPAMESSSMRGIGGA